MSLSHFKTVSIWNNLTIFARTATTTIADNLIVCFSWHLLASADKTQIIKTTILKTTYGKVFPISLAVWHLEESLKLEVSRPVNFFPRVSVPHLCLCHFEDV